MEADRTAIILEAQWMEKEIPKLEDELKALKKLEQDLLTTPLEAVNQAYTSTYRSERQWAYPFYHRRRTVRATRYGYRERMLDVGWLTLAARVLILALVIWAGYIVYHNHQRGDLTRGIIWGAVVLVFAIGLAFAPAVGDVLWERRARRKAEEAAQAVRRSEAFAQERQGRQARLKQCQSRVAELEERLRFARARYNRLRRQLTGTNHDGETAEGEPETDQDA
jgi:nitrate reductase assembly molybdenum cofactor insertion protein NarJ